jgi:hypothetical protein
VRRPRSFKDCRATGGGGGGIYWYKHSNPLSGANLHLYHVANCFYRFSVSSVFTSEHSEKVGAFHQKFSDCWGNAVMAPGNIFSSFLITTAGAPFATLLYPILCLMLHVFSVFSEGTGHLD